MRVRLVWQFNKKTNFVIKNKPKNFIFHLVLLVKSEEIEFDDLKLVLLVHCCKALS